MRELAQTLDALSTADVSPDPPPAPPVPPSVRFRSTHARARRLFRSLTRRVATDAAISAERPPMLHAHRERPEREGALRSRGRPAPRAVTAETLGSGRVREWQRARAATAQGCGSGATACRRRHGAARSAYREHAVAAAGDESRDAAEEFARGRPRLNPPAGAFFFFSHRARARAGPFVRRALQRPADETDRHSEPGA